VFRIGEATGAADKIRSRGADAGAAGQHDAGGQPPRTRSAALPAGDDFRALLARLAESEASNELERRSGASPVEDAVVDTAHDDAPIVETIAVRAGAAAVETTAAKRDCNGIDAGAERCTRFRPRIPRSPRCVASWRRCAP
jgi:hypothetical protein